MSKIRIFLNEIEAYDMAEDTSLVRELEMAVDAVLTFNPSYSIQFWKDSRLYGIDEAKLYLINFVEKEYHSPEDLAKDMNAVCQIIDKIHHALGRGVKIPTMR